MAVVEANVTLAPDPVVATRYVGQLVSELTDARVALKDRKDEVTLDDEKQFAQSWLTRRLEEMQRDRLDRGEPALEPVELDKIRASAFETSFSSAALWRAWVDDYATAQNLWVSGTGRCKVQLGDGTIVDGPSLAESNEELTRAVRRLLREKSTRPNQQWNEMNHQVEFVTDDGTRVTGVIAVTQDPFVTFRRPTLNRIRLTDLVANDTMSNDCAELLEAAVQSRMRMLIGGSMNTGKTVLLRALAAALPKEWITVTVESQAELGLRAAAGAVYPDFIVELEGRKAGADGHGEVTLNQLIEDAQRLSPDCVLVGEVRGEEAIALSKAVSQGYQVMATIHSYSAAEAVTNAGLYLEQYTAMATKPALRRIANGIDIAVFMERGRDGQRRVAEVAAVDADLDGNLKVDVLIDGDGARSVLPERLKKTFRNNGFDW